MARAYYPDGGTFKPFTPEMVGAIGYYQTTMFHTAVLKLGTYQAQSTSSGDGFTIVSTITAGYNGNLPQQLVSILTFRFGNGSGTLYGGWQTSFPAYNTDVEYYYTVSGSNVTVYCKNDAYNSQNTYYEFIGRTEGWTNNSVVATLPSGATKFTPVYTSTSADAQIVVSGSQPSNPSAVLWVKP